MSTEILHELSDISERFHRISKCGDLGALHEARTRIIALRNKVKSLPDGDVVVLRKIRVDAPEVLQEDWEELRTALVQKGFQVL